MGRNQLKKILYRNVGGIRQLLGDQILNYFVSHEKNLGADADALLDALIGAMSSELLNDPSLRRLLFASLEPQWLNHLANLLNVATAGLRPAQVAERVANQFELIESVRNFFKETLQLDELLPAEDVPRGKANAEGVFEPHPMSSDYFELHLYQAELKDKIVEAVRESSDTKMLVRVPTGGGKTRIGLHSVFALHNFQFKPGDLTLWLAYQPVLLEQAHETALKIFPTLGKISMQFHRIDSSNKIEFSDDSGILFANPTTLNRVDRAVLERLRSRTRMVVFDETHQIVAANAFEFINKLTFENTNAAVLGMTATPARADLGLESMKLARFFGPKFDISVPQKDVVIGDSKDVDEISRERNAIRYLQEIKILAKLREERHFVDCGDLGIEHPDRTKKIIDLCEKYSSQGKKMLVFAENVQDARALSFLLNLKCIPNGLVLGSNKQSRQGFIDSYRKTDTMNILISVDVLTTGFDAPETNILLIARKTGSAVLFCQILGRALRGPKNKGHEENLILHVTDPAFEWASLYETFTDYMRYR